MIWRWLTLTIFVLALIISGTHRARARRSGGTIPRRSEGALFFTLRALVALALFGAVLLHSLKPSWMRWAMLELPVELRLMGLILGIVALPVIQWVLQSLGSNVSETILTKEHHQLVTGGPYRWVRHPLYTTSLALFLALGLMLGSWLVLSLCILVLALLRWLVIPREEHALIARFGEDYQEYIRHTGRLLPGW
jgi:protein-S-isoprenylcysteine O-methyltransferase Ste14